MAYPIGNDFWKRRTKHGRDRIFADPETMLQACYEYFKYQSERTWEKKEAVKSGEFTGQLVSVPTSSPFSIEGLCLFLGVHSKYLNEFEKGLKPSELEIDYDFSNIINHVREIIYIQKIEGATVGAYNASIVARQLGLAEITKGEITGKNGGAIETNNTLTINMVTGSKSLASTEKEIQEAIERELE